MEGMPLLALTPPPPFSVVSDQAWKAMIDAGLLKPPPPAASLTVRGGAHQ